MASLNQQRRANTALCAKESTSFSSLEAPPPSSFDYLYQAIALIEAKNSSIHPSHNQQSISTSASPDYSSAAIAAAAAAAVAAQSNINTRRILGNLIYQNPQVQQNSSFVTPKNESFNHQSQNFSHFHLKEPHSIHLFHPDQIETMCLNQYCECKPIMELKTTNEPNKLAGRLEKAKEFARRTNSVAGGYSNISTESSESCTESLYGSSQDDELKESPTPTSSTSTPSPLAASSPITNFNCPSLSTNHNTYSLTSPAPTTTSATNNNSASAINPLEFISNLLPLYLNSYLKTLNQSMLYSATPNTQEQLVFIQNLIDLINSVTTYQQQQNEMNSICHSIAAQQQLLHNHNPHNFMAQIANSSNSWNKNSFMSSNAQMPFRKTMASTSVYNDTTIPINKNMSLTKKERPLLTKKKAVSLIKSNPKNIKAKLSFAIHHKNRGLNLHNKKHTYYHSTHITSSSLHLMPTADIEDGEEIQTKVEEHFKKSLGNNYFKYLSENCHKL